MKIVFRGTPEFARRPLEYLYKNTRGKILYIGKAKQLKKRVASYFSKKHGDKTDLLIKEIDKIDVIVTDNEVEALILEARLIRQHKPKYNIDLKDGVRYAYLKVTNEDYPRLLTVRQKEKDKAKYYGPFTDGTARENSARLLRTIFRVRTCGKKLPKNVCLQYYIGNCSAPCEGHISQKDYLASVSKLQSVLRGQIKKVVKLLEQEMKGYSLEKMYEIAKVRRDQIKSLRQFAQRQKISIHKTYNEDVLNYIEVGGKVYLQLFRVDRGNVVNKQEFTFEPATEIIESFVKQYYASASSIPPNILLQYPLVEPDVIAGWLKNQRGSPVRIQVPRRGRQGYALPNHPWRRYRSPAILAS